MSDVNTILLVDPDARTRTLIADQLKPLGYTILHATNGADALQLVVEHDVKLVVTELYLSTGDDECLVHAIRRDKSFRKTRTLVHTQRSTNADREWAMRAGADAYLIKPTRAERVRYVVARLTTTRGANAALPQTSSGSMVRRESLDVALTELEQGKLQGTHSIVFGRAWWMQLSSPRQSAYRRRAKRAHVHLRSDSMLGEYFVEVRGNAPEDRKFATERSESPYR